MKEVLICNITETREITIRWTDIITAQKIRNTEEQIMNLEKRLMGLIVVGE